MRLAGARLEGGEEISKGKRGKNDIRSGKLIETYQVQRARSRLLHHFRLLLPGLERSSLKPRIIKSGRRRRGSILEFSFFLFLSERPRRRKGRKRRNGPRRFVSSLLSLSFYLVPSPSGSAGCFEPFIFLELIRFE